MTRSAASAFGWQRRRKNGDDSGSLMRSSGAGDPHHAVCDWNSGGAISSDIRLSSEAARPAWLIEGPRGEGLPSIEVAHVVLTGGGERPAKGRTVWLDPAFELLVHPFDCVRGARALLHWLGSNWVKVNADRRLPPHCQRPAVRELPFVNERLAALCDVFRRGRIDRTCRYSRRRFPHAGARARAQADCDAYDPAPLHRHAVPDCGARSQSRHAINLRIVGRRRPRSIRPSRTECHASVDYQEPARSHRRIKSEQRFSGHAGRRFAGSEGRLTRH